MLFIKRKETDPYFNIAAEEYVLKNFHKECFMLWRNQPSIIIGKHQNALSEINLNFVEKNNLPVIRRITGGGTVYHDLGNLNFTFTKKAPSENLVNFKKFIELIIYALTTLNIDAKFENKNSITLNKKKISGNAEHIYKNNVLHHGTLLFSTQLDHMEKALHTDSSNFTDNAVKSIRSQVTNIVQHLPKPMSIDEFENNIRNSFLTSDKHAEFYEFSKSDITKINKLVKEKYATWKWNFGYSPKYNFTKKIYSDKGNTRFKLDVVNGTISKLKIYSDFISKKKTSEIELFLTGILHHKKEIENILKKNDFNKNFEDINLNEFIQGMF